MAAKRRYYPEFAPLPVPRPRRTRTRARKNPRVPCIATPLRNRFIYEQARFDLHGRTYGVDGCDSRRVHNFPAYHTINVATGKVRAVDKRDVRRWLSQGTHNIKTRAGYPMTTIESFGGKARAKPVARKPAKRRAR